MTSVDPGLPAATQRVLDETERHEEQHPDCSCGWRYIGGDETWDHHLGASLARAAREDVDRLVWDAIGEAVRDPAAFIPEVDERERNIKSTEMERGR